METFDTIFDWSVLHQVRLMKLSVYLYRQAAREIDQSEDALAQVASEVAYIIASKGGLRADDARTKSQIDKHRQQIIQARTAKFSLAFAGLKTEFSKLKSYESRFFAALMEAGGKSVVVPKTIPIDPEIMGFTLDNWRQRLLGNDVRRLNTGLSLGARLGDTEAALRARLVGRSVYRGSDGLVESTRRELDTFTRTATDVFADIARVTTAFENPLRNKEVYVALLDSRTTKDCKGLHGKVYQTGKGPRPPLHWFCRSTRVPVVGSGPSRIPGYKEWLNRLSTKDQDQVLGRRQATAFRNRALDITTFSEPSWPGIDFNALANQERHVFEAAGMDVPFQ